MSYRTWFDDRLRRFNAPDSIERYMSHEKEYDGALQIHHGMKLRSIHPVALRLRQNRLGG